MLIRGRLFLKKDEGKKFSNKMNTKNKKADVAITLLVLMTLVLAGATLFIFNINQGKVETSIGDYSFLNSVYLKENQIDFYVNNALDEVIKNFEVNSGKDKFIEEFKTELEKYKVDGKFIILELEKVEEQVQTDKFVFDSVGKKIILKLDIRLDEKPSKDMTIAYAYTKTFEKTLIS
ncbi:MAG: hypothetical protein AABW67_01200 [Nanoarchaeota archaeon]